MLGVILLQTLEKKQGQQRISANDSVCLVKPQPSFTTPKTNLYELSLTHSPKHTVR